MQIKQRTARLPQNIFTDEESSAISTPEYVAKHMIETIQHYGTYHTAVELCCCIGVTSIQLAQHIQHVIGIDIDAHRIQMAQQNAELYQVANRVQFRVGDVLDTELLQSIDGDLVLIDPVWSTRKMDRSSFVSDLNLTTPSMLETFANAQQYISHNIVIRIPATIKSEKLRELGICKIENIIVNNELVFKVAYFLDGIDATFEENIIFE